MKGSKTLLISSIEVVTFLFTAFGGFLKRIAPPDQVGASYPIGIMSFLMLAILLAISAVSRNAATQNATKKWIVAGTALLLFALPFSFLYPYLLSHYTYPHQMELSKRQVGASDEYLTSDARQYKLAHPDATAEELTQNLPDDDVWTRAGIDRTELELLAVYAGLLLALAGAIFCLLEANLKEFKTSDTAGAAS